MGGLVCRLLLLHAQHVHHCSLTEIAFVVSMLPTTTSSLSTVATTGSRLLRRRLHALHHDHGWLPLRLTRSLPWPSSRLCSLVVLRRGRALPALQVGGGGGGGRAGRGSRACVLPFPNGSCFVLIESSFVCASNFIILHAKTKE